MISVSAVSWPAVSANGSRATTRAGSAPSKCRARRPRRLTLPQRRLQLQQFGIRHRGARSFNLCRAGGKVQSTYRVGYRR